MTLMAKKANGSIDHCCIHQGSDERAIFFLPVVCACVYVCSVLCLSKDSLVRMSDVYIENRASPLEAVRASDKQC